MASFRSTHCEKKLVQTHKVHASGQTQVVLNSGSSAGLSNLGLLSVAWAKRGKVLARYFSVGADNRPVCVQTRTSRHALFMWLANLAQLFGNWSRWLNTNPWTFFLSLGCLEEAYAVLILASINWS